MNTALMVPGAGAYFTDPFAHYSRGQCIAAELAEEIDAVCAAYRGEVPATSATGPINGQTSIERGDLQVFWLRRCLMQCLSTTTEPAPHSRSALFLAASTEANHELDAALAADMVLDGMVDRLPAGRAEARSEIRQLRPEADPCVASPHEKFLPYKQAERAVQGILPEGTPILVVDNICPSGLYAFPAPWVNGRWMGPAQLARSPLKMRDAHESRGFRSHGRNCSPLWATSRYPSPCHGGGAVDCPGRGTGRLRLPADDA
ncbi:hypothetical protein [Saccharopolyspora pogona]|uniref:hypothetical protein n=1 Tax=Saccharopolyspora pogona TaxID=333966 RepID=UPI001688489C|nr:hypothetical protein [Saccharopolyspora pogona]